MFAVKASCSWCLLEATGHSKDRVSWVTDFTLQWIA